jgi:Glycosyltransferase family 87
MRTPSRILLYVLCTLALVALAPASAGAQSDPLVPASVTPPSETTPPPGFKVSLREARRIADRQPEVRNERAKDPHLERQGDIPLNLGGPRRYEFLYYHPDDLRIVADVEVSGLTGRVLKVWTGPQAGMLLARGIKPPMGRSLNSPWIWFPLAIVFMLPFVDPRRPFRLVHLDLLMLLGFGLSQIWFNRGEVNISVPLVYPFLAYLLGRMLFAGFRPRERREPLIPFARVPWLAVGLIALVIFRIVLNLVDSSVIDVGYASVIGADRIEHKLPLYVFNEVHGDTYGPVNYLAYLPFELVFPTHGRWDFVPAAHAAAITFDLLVILELMLLGARLREGREGRVLGLAMAFAWAAYPYSLFALQANTNDVLIPVLVLGALLMLASPPMRGLMLGLATAAKFAPAALAPLLATGLGDERKRRAWPAFALSFVGVCALAVALYLPDGGIREFYDTTIGYQLSRNSPFSPWGQWPSLVPLQHVLDAGAIALAGLVAFVPRRRDLRQVAALAAAVTIAVQATAVHWFYFYIVWFAPLVLTVSLAAYRERAPTAATALDGWTRTKSLPS